MLRSTVALSPPSLPPPSFPLLMSYVAASSVRLSALPPLNANDFFSSACPPAGWKALEKKRRRRCLPAALALRVVRQRRPSFPSLRDFTVSLFIPRMPPGRGRPAGWPSLARSFELASLPHHCGVGRFRLARSSFVRPYSPLLPSFRLYVPVAAVAHSASYGPPSIGQGRQGPFPFANANESRMRRRDNTFWKSVP